jgi:transposase
MYAQDNPAHTIAEYAPILAILSGNPMAVRDIARHLNINLGTTYRYVRELLSLGMLTGQIYFVRSRRTTKYTSTIQEFQLWIGARNGQVQQSGAILFRDGTIWCLERILAEEKTEQPLPITVTSRLLSSAGLPGSR